MSGSAPSGEGQAPGTGQPQEGTPQTAPQAGAGEQQRTYKTLEEAQAAIDRLQRELERTNREAASHRVENKTLKQQQEDAERARLSDLEKAQKDAAKHQQTAAELQQKYQALAVRMSIRDQASGLNFYDPEDAFRFLLASGELEYDDEGLPKNAEKLLKSLAENKPYLIKQQATPPTPAPQVGLTPANPSRSSQSALPPFDPKNPPRLTDRATWDNSKR